MPLPLRPRFLDPIRERVADEKRERVPDVSRPTAVAIGAGMSGLLAAAALADHAPVTLIERDTLPAGPEPRRGVPPARQAHLVWTGGVTALDTLLPGLTEDLVARGARLAHIMGDMVSRAPNEIWFRRVTSTRTATWSAPETCWTP